MKTPTKAALSILLALSQNALASGDSIYDLTLKELLQVKVVTAASGFEQKLQRVGANALVIQREEWQAIGAYTLTDVLHTFAGVHPTKPQVNYNHNVFSIRGMKGSFGEHVKLLIDGLPFEYVKDSGSYIGLNMPIDQFKRIEVVKGPGSAVYGADAFAGVINLVSFDIDETPSSFSIKRGQFDTQSIAFSHALSAGEHQFSIALDYMTSDDDPGRIIQSDLQSTFDQLFDSNASNAPGPLDEHYRVLSLTSQWQWADWAVKYHTWRNFDFGLGAGVAQALDTQGWGSAKHDTLTVNWDLSDKVGLGQFDLAATLTHGRVWSTLYVFPAGSRLPIGSDGNLNLVDPVGMTLFTDGYIGTPGSISFTRELKMTHLFDAGDHKLRWEGGYQQIDFRPIEHKNFGPGILNGNQSEIDGTLTDVSNTPWAYVPRIHRHFYYVSVLDEWDISDQWLLSLGARFDRYSDFGSTTNPRISLRYQYRPELSLKLFAGSAFRAPSIGELYYQNNPVAYGNPELGPEGVNTLESGFGLDLLLNENLYLSLGFFDYQANDLIETVFDSTLNANVAQNIGKQEGYGGELSLRWKPQNEITVNFNYSYLHTDRNDTGPVDSLPHHMVKMDMNWRITPDWHWSFDSRWIMDRHRRADDTRAKIKDYQIFNTRLAYNGLMESVTVALKVKNLFDADAREPSNGTIGEDYPLQGRQWMLELSYRF